MYNILEKTVQELKRLHPNEIAHMASYEEHIRTHRGEIKTEYSSSVYVSEKFLNGRTVTTNFHDRFSPPDYHAHKFLELIYIFDGEFINTVEGHEIIMKKGDACFIPPNVYHSFDIIEKNTKKRLDCAAVNIFVSISHLQEYLKECKNELLDRFSSGICSAKSHRKYIFCKCLKDEISSNMVALLHHEIRMTKEKDGVINENTSAALFKALLSELCGSRYEVIPSAAFTNNSSTGDILKYISDNFSTVTLDSIAENFNYSFSYASKIIKQRTGLCFSALITQIRLENAEKMLLTTDKSIKETAKECGYGSIEHFHRAFKKYKGMTPLDFRNTQQK